MKQKQPEIFCTHCGASNLSTATHCFACKKTLDATEDTFIGADATNTTQFLQQRYRLLTMIGEGGFSKVYRAEDTYTHRLVAIKSVNLQGLNAQEKIEATDSFNREVHMLTKLNQRNLPHLYQHFSDTEHWYMVMDYINGATLEQLLHEQHTSLFTLNEVLELGIILCDVLDYLHNHEPPIIFRDLKPANIMITPEGHLYLIDFGIARHFKAGQSKDTIPFGSPGYAAPEQYGRAQTTPRADIYSLGAILHQLISGHDPAQTPFSFPTLMDRSQPARRQLDKLLQSMLALDSEQRPGTVVTVRHQLQEIERLASRSTGVYNHHNLSSSLTSRIAPTFGTATGYSNAISSPWSYTSPSQSMYMNQQAQMQVVHSYGGFPQPHVTYIPGGSQGLQAQRPPIGKPTAAAKKAKNIPAIISLLWGLTSILLLPSLCGVMVSIVHNATQSSFFIFMALTILPTIIGIICGHCGLHNAHKRATKKWISITGLTLNYAQLGIYLSLSVIITSLIHFIIF